MRMRLRLVLGARSGAPDEKPAPMTPTSRHQGAAVNGKRQECARRAPRTDSTRPRTHPARPGAPLPALCHYERMARDRGGEPSAEGPQRGASNLRSLGDAPSVLVVEDDPSGQMAVTAALEPLGYAVSVQPSGEDALRELLRAEFAVVVVDVSLPGLDGFALVEAMRGRREHQHTPVIFLTGRDNGDTNIARSYALGAVDYLLKPIRADSLRAKVHLCAELFQKRRLLRQARREKEQAEARYKQSLLEVMEGHPASTVQLRAHFSELSDPTLVVSNQGQLLFANPSANAVFGFPENHRHAQFGVPASAQGKLQILSQDGIRHYRYSSTPLKWDEQSARAVTIHDTTHEHELEDALAAAQKIEATSRIAAGVAHDFNNLLTIIQSFGGFVRDGLPDDHTNRADIDEVLKAAERAAKLTRHLLEFAREQPTRPTFIDPNELVRQMERMLAQTVGAHIELRLSLNADAGVVFIDGAQLEQTILNLAINARDAMLGRGTVTVSTGWSPRADGREMVFIRFQDTGTGMSPEVLARIFDPFFTTKKPGSGTGLGLSASRGLIERAHGTIEVESEINVGSVFEIRLPRARPQPRSEKTVDKGSTPVPETLGATLLIVDDEKTITTALARKLRKLGHSVLTANSGAAALAIVETEAKKISLLLLDVIMPEMTGPETLRRVRELCPGLGVLFMTGYDYALLEREDLRGVPVLRKPCSDKELADAVTDALARCE